MTEQTPERESEQGYLLLALVVVMFLLALFLTIAAPTMARSLERDKEVESEHRAQQYVRAIHDYYMKFNSYPASLDVLLTSNKQHFLRQQYKDPLTGGDYKLIHFGEAKTEVKGFFGEPLEGLAQGSLGSMAGSASGIGTGVGGAGSTSSGTGTSSSSGGFSLGTSSFSSGSSFGGTSSGLSGTSSTTSSVTTGSTSTSGTDSSSTSSASGTSATKFQGSKGMIVGVGSNASGPGQVEWNGSANIQDWEFLYDHRTWLLKQRVSIFGGSAGASGGGSFGSLSSPNGSTNGLGSNTPSFGTTAGAGSTDASSSGSSAGSASGSPNGNSGSSSGSGTTSNPTQPQ